VSRNDTRGERSCGRFVTLRGGRGRIRGGSSSREEREFEREDGERYARR